MSEAEKHDVIEPGNNIVPDALPHGVLDEATLFASPLPITGQRKTTTRKELWVSMTDLT